MSRSVVSKIFSPLYILRPALTCWVLAIQVSRDGWPKERVEGSWVSLRQVGRDWDSLRSLVIRSVTLYLYRWIGCLKLKVFELSVSG